MAYIIYGITFWFVQFIIHTLWKRYCHKSKKKAILEFNQERISKYTEMKAKVKWYDDPQMVGTILLFWPPLGIYGVYKSQTIEQKWKNITYGVVVVVGLLLIKAFL